MSASNIEGAGATHTSAGGGPPTPQLPPPRGTSLPAACPFSRLGPSCSAPAPAPTSRSCPKRGRGGRRQEQGLEEPSLHVGPADPRVPSLPQGPGLWARWPGGQVPCRAGRSTMTADPGRVPPCSVFGVNASPCVKPMAKCPALSPVPRAVNSLLPPALPVASAKFSVGVPRRRSRTVFPWRTKWDGNTPGPEEGRRF